MFEQKIADASVWKTFHHIDFKEIQLTDIYFQIIFSGSRLSKFLLNQYLPFRETYNNVELV